MMALVIYLYFLPLEIDLVKLPYGNLEARLAIQLSKSIHPNQYDGSYLALFDGKYATYCGGVRFCANKNAPTRSRSVKIYAQRRSSRRLLSYLNLSIMPFFFSIGPLFKGNTKYTLRHVIVKYFFNYFNGRATAADERKLLEHYQFSACANYCAISWLILNTGRKSEITIPPTTIPRKAMTSGSIRLVRAEVAASTCSS